MPSGLSISAPMGSGTSTSGSALTPSCSSYCTRILANEVYSAILIMVISTTFVVPPVLKVLFKKQDARRRGDPSGSGPGVTGSHPGITGSYPGLT